MKIHKPHRTSNIAFNLEADRSCIIRHQLHWCALWRCLLSMATNILFMHRTCSVVDIFSRDFYDANFDTVVSFSCPCVACASVIHWLQGTILCVVNEQQMHFRAFSGATRAHPMTMWRMWRTGGRSTVNFWHNFEEFLFVIAFLLLCCLCTPEYGIEYAVAIYFPQRSILFIKTKVFDCFNRW